MTELYWQLYNRLSFTDEGRSGAISKAKLTWKQINDIKGSGKQVCSEFKKRIFCQAVVVYQTETEYLPVIEERRTAHIERAKQKKATSFPIPQGPKMAFLTYTDIWHQRSIRRLSFTEDTKHTKLQHEIFKSHVTWKNVMTLDTALIIYPACLIFPGSCASY